MTRILDAYAIFEGEEPIFSTELTKIDMVKTLNWYCQNKVSKDSEKYILTYFKKNHKLNLEAEELKSCSTTFGYICRIITNGGILNSTNQTWFDEKVQEIKKSIGAKKVVPVIALVTKNNVISIQDRMAEKISIVAGELEGSVDDYVLNDFNKTPSPYSIMSDTIKAMHSPKIVTIFKKHRDEIELAITSDDDQLKEGYSHRSKSQLKKLAAYYNLIISDAIKLSEESKQGRKPRKTKAKTPAKLVAKLNYMDKFTELDLTSVPPQNIIGASALWVYNTKIRKLGCYYSDDISGLSVKGSTIVNYSPSKSTQKKVRKPNDVVPKIVTGTKQYLKSAANNIVAVESSLTGRINKDIILVRVVK